MFETVQLTIGVKRDFLPILTVILSINTYFPVTMHTLWQGMKLEVLRLTGKP